MRQPRIERTQVSRTSELMLLGIGMVAERGMEDGKG